MDRQSLDEQMRGLLRLIAQTQRDIELAETLGETENYAPGTVIQFSKTFSGRPEPVYSFAAIKYLGRWETPLWAVTGRSGLHGLTWPQLVDEIFRNAADVKISIAFPTQFVTLWPAERPAVEQTVDAYANATFEALRAGGVSADQFAQAVRNNALRLTNDNLVADVAKDATTEALKLDKDWTEMTHDERAAFANMSPLPPGALRHMTLAQREEFSRKSRERATELREHMTQPKPGDDV